MSRSATRELDDAVARILRGATAADCESPTLDFQQDTGSPGDLERSIVKAAICFANAAGGIIVLGVADRTGGREAFTGTSIDAERLRQRIHETTAPRLLVDMEVLDTPARLVVVHVRMSAAVHADTQGRAWQRINRDCKPLTPADQARLVDERRGYDWSAEVSERPIDHVAPEALAQARRLLANLTDSRNRLAALGDADLLAALGVLEERRWMTRAGELLFCPTPSGAEDAILYQHRQTPGGEPRTVQRPSFPLLTAFMRVQDLVSARQDTTPITLPTGQQIVIEDFPRDAVREALSNAICHRDWRVAGIITVDHAPEVLSIVSPGPLVSGVTPENILTTNSHPRNPSLARAARQLGLAEETGRGVDRMFREAVRAGKELPAIDGLYDRVRVSFRGGAPDTNIARFIAQLPREEQDDTDTMLLLFHLCRLRTVTAAQAAPLLQKPMEEVALVLRRLTAERIALLEPTRESAARRRPTYRLRGQALRGLGAAVTYNRRTVDDTDRKIIAHVKEYGKITNRTLQNIFDVSIVKARNILADLASRQILQRVSVHSRGPGVEWGAGPRFPASRPSRKDSAAAIQTSAQTELPLQDRSGRPRRHAKPTSGGES